MLKCSGVSHLKSCWSFKPKMAGSRCVPSLAFLCQLINRILISMIVPPLANPTLNRCAGWANGPFSSVSWPGSGFAGGTNSSNNNTSHLSVPLTPVGAHFRGHDAVRRPGESPSSGLPA
jgi:hypothetical protein